MPRLTFVKSVRTDGNSPAATRSRVAAWSRVRGLVAGVLAAALLLATGCTLNQPEARSAVGVARRTDGTVVLVTVWCAGERTENPQISTYVPTSQDSEQSRVLFEARGRSADPITVMEVGLEAPGYTLTVNEPLPESESLIAFNYGSQQQLFREVSYPSSAAVFALHELPISDAAIPDPVLTGPRKVISSSELSNTKCQPQG